MALLDCLDFKTIITLSILCTLNATELLKTFYCYCPVLCECENLKREMSLFLIKQSISKSLISLKLVSCYFLVFYSFYIKLELLYLYYLNSLYKILLEEEDKTIFLLVELLLVSFSCFH